jgi:hypothetical protein
VIKETVEVEKVVTKGVEKVVQVTPTPPPITTTVLYKIGHLADNGDKTKPSEGR